MKSKILVCKATSKERVGFVSCSEEETPGGQWCKAILTSTICFQGCSHRFHTGLPWARMESLLWRHCLSGNAGKETVSQWVLLPLQRHLVYSGLLLCPSINKLNLFPSVLQPHPSTSIEVSLLWWFFFPLSSNSCHCFSPQDVSFTSMYFFYPLHSREPLLRCLTHGRQSWLHCVFKKGHGCCSVVNHHVAYTSNSEVPHVLYKHSLNNCIY